MGALSQKSNARTQKQKEELEKKQITKLRQLEERQEKEQKLRAEELQARRVAEQKVWDERSVSYGVGCGQTSRGVLMPSSSDPIAACQQQSYGTFSTDRSRTKTGTLSLIDLPSYELS